MATPADFPPVFEDKLSDIPRAEREIFGRELSAARAYALEANPVQGKYDITRLAAILGSSTEKAFHRQ